MIRLRQILDAIQRQIRPAELFRAHQRHIQRAGLIAAGVVTFALFFTIGAFVRLLVGPVSLGPFNGEVADAISQSLPGLAVGYDQAAIEWSRDEHRVNLVILGARVLDGEQRIIAQAPKAEIDLAAGPFLRGKIVVQRIALVGVQLTLVRTKTGALRLGVERDASDNDVLDRIREAISHAKGGTAALESFAVRHARLAFLDELTGAFVVSPDANFQISTGEGIQAKESPYLETTVDAALEISGAPAHVIANVKLPRSEGPVTGDVSVTGLSLRALGHNAKTFGFLVPFDLKTDISGSFVLEHATFLRYADLGIGASGAMYGLGAPLHVRSLKLVARYDGRTGRLLVDDASLEGDHVRAHMAGQGNLIFGSNNTLTSAALDLTADQFTVNLPGVVKQAVTLGRIAIRTVYTPADQKIAIERFDISGGAMNAQIKGAVTLENDQSPAVALDGTIGAMAVRDFLHYWPLHVGEGAREWINDNITTGRIGPVAIHTALKPGALDLPALPDDALNLTIPLNGATVTYVHGLSPMTAVQGVATLTGDTFKATIASGNVGAIKVSAGAVTIPNLHVHGTVGDMKAHINGSVSDILSLIDQKPLQFASRFHLNPASSKGTASTDLDFHVPMLRDVNVDNLGISVKAAVTNFGVALGKSTKITGGNVNFDVTNERLHAIGSVAIGGAAVGIDWTEDFKTKADITTNLIAKGTIDEATRAALNLNTSEFFSGPVFVSAHALGHRGVIRRANVTMDLTPATMALDIINFHKPPGAAATAQLNAQFDNDGNARVETIVVTGPALNAHGTVAFASNGDLTRLDLQDVRAGPNNDFALTLSDTPAKGFDLSVHGRSADGTGLGHRNAASANNTAPNQAASNEPFLISARLDRVVLRDGVSLSGFALDVAGIGNRPQTMTLNASLPKAKIAASIAPGDEGRRVALTTGDAGTLLKGLFGFESMRGGDLAVNATLSPLPKANAKVLDYSGNIVIKDFKILNQPFLARLFSAGSLDGILDLMRGDGITIEKLEVPFKAQNDVITIREARASGPAVGITADGYVDRGNNKLALKGTLAPVYGLNSVLGVIPLLGDVLVSKKGEGVFGMTYSATGSADQPNVSVNPLSALAPGIFRRIFEGSMPEAPSQANTNPAPPPRQQ